MQRAQRNIRTRTSVPVLIADVTFCKVPSSYSGRYLLKIFLFRVNKCFYSDTNAAAAGAATGAAAVAGAATGAAASAAATAAASAAASAACI